MGTQLLSKCVTIDGSISDIIFYFVKCECSKLNRLMISYLSNKFAIFYKAINFQSSDFLHNSIDKKYDNISVFLIRMHYEI